MAKKHVYEIFRDQGLGKSSAVFIESTDMESAFFQFLSDYLRFDENSEVYIPDYNIRQIEIINRKLPRRSMKNRTVLK